MTNSTESGAKALEPCPFCGGTAGVWENWRVICAVCDASGPEDEANTLEQNIATWNRRHQPAAAQLAGWLSIESAPKSSESILAINESGRIAIETGHYIHNMMHAAKVDREPCYWTHWMPLPPSPPTQPKEPSNG